MRARETSEKNRSLSQAGAEEDYQADFGRNRLRTFRGLKFLLALAIGLSFVVPLYASPMAYYTTETNTDFAQFGVGGTFYSTSGVLRPRGIPSGSVSRVLLYWHRSANTTSSTSTIVFDGSSVTGNSVGSADDGAWSLAWNQSYRADVTSLYRDTSPTYDYSLSSLSNVSGASLIVFFQDGNTSNNRDVRIYNGNDSNDVNSTDTTGWSIPLNGIDYVSGSGRLIVHVADGQVFDDDALRLNGIVIDSGPAVFEGSVLPLVPGVPVGQEGSLWDINSYSITTFLSPGNNNLLLSTSILDDHFVMVAATVDVETATPPAMGTVTSLVSSPDPSTPGQPVTFTASVTSGGSPVTTGTVTFIEGGSCASPASTLGSDALNGSGQASIINSSLSIGSHTITACYGGASGFEPSSDNDSHTVGQAGQTINFAPLPNKVVTDPNFNVTATATSGLAVSFGSLTPSACTVSGNTVDIISVGTCTIRASQAGNGTFEAAPNVDQSFSIGQATQTINFPAPANRTFGDADFTVSATATSGLAVTFSSQTASRCTVLGNTVHIVSAGTCTLRASQGGNATYEAAPNVDRSFTINKANASCNVTPYNLIYDAVPHTATGSCTGVGGVLLAGLNLSGTTHTNAGNYPNDPWTFTDSTGNYNDTSGSVADVISKANTTTTINSDTPDPSVFGQNYTVDATVAVNSPGAGSPTGSISISDGGGNTCSIVLPALSCMMASTSPGPKTLTAVYSGDANFNTSSDTEAHQVDKAGTTTTINSDSPDPSVFGQDYVVNATVAVNAPGAGTPSGAIAVNDGSGNSCTITLPNSTCTLSSTSPGAKTLTATYVGDANFEGSSDTETHQVDKANTNTTINSDGPDPSVFGQPYTVNATLSVVAPGMGTPTGSISVNDDLGNVCTITLPASDCSLASTAVGLRTVTATYLGDANFNGSSDTESHQVNKADTTTTVTSSQDPSVFGQLVTFTATVSAAPPGAGTPNGTISFNIDGILYCLNTPLNAARQAVCSQAGLPALPAGVRNVVAIYSGDINFNPSAGTFNQTVNLAATTTTITRDGPDPSLVNQPYSITWTVSPNAPGAGSPSGTVTVNGGTGGGTCSAPAAAGTCTLTPISVGSKTVVATFTGDANFEASISAAVTHDVNLEITGNIRQMPANVPLAGVQVVLGGSLGSTATTDASGNYRFAGFFSGDYTVTPNVASPSPGRVYDAVRRVYNGVTNNIGAADFLAYNSINDAPRKLTLPITHVRPGSAVSMPVILESQGNETSVSFSFTYDINPLAQVPIVTCGSDAPDCALSSDSSILGRIGVTIAPGVDGFTNREAAGSNEIAQINFQTVATTLSNSPVSFADSPVVRSIGDNSGNSLLTHYLDGYLVFSQGLEGDLACPGACKTGDNSLLANDVVKARLFTTGIMAPDPLYNEFQRADTAPAASHGDGRLDATDIVQTRRYTAGLDLPQSAGGPEIPGEPHPQRPTGYLGSDRTVQLGSMSAVAGSSVTLAIDAATVGDEVTMSFSLVYDPTKLANPRIDLGTAAPLDAVVTVNTKEPGIIVVVVDSPSAFETSKSSHLLNVTFDVSKSASGGDTAVTFDNGVISDAVARPLPVVFTSGKINIAGLEVSDHKLSEAGLFIFAAIDRNPTLPRESVLPRFDHRYDKPTKMIFVGRE